MKRGLDLATLLADVLAGKDRSAVLAFHGVGLHLRPEEALRKALDQVETRRALLDADDDRFGRCDVCSLDLGVPALDELAWADRCQQHAR
jgi:hypothetical protein